MCRVDSVTEPLLRGEGLFFWLLKRWEPNNGNATTFSVFLYPAGSPGFPNRFLMEFGCFLPFCAQSKLWKMIKDVPLSEKHEAMCFSRNILGFCWDPLKHSLFSAQKRPHWQWKFFDSFQYQSATASNSNKEAKPYIYICIYKRRKLEKQTVLNKSSCLAACSQGSF